MPNASFSAIYAGSACGVKNAKQREITTYRALFDTLYMYDVNLICPLGAQLAGEYGATLVFFYLITRLGRYNFGGFFSDGGDPICK